MVCLTVPHPFRPALSRVCCGCWSTSTRNVTFCYSSYPLSCVLPQNGCFCAYRNAPCLFIRTYVIAPNASSTERATHKYDPTRDFVSLPLIRWHCLTCAIITQRSNGWLPPGAAVLPASSSFIKQSAVDGQSTRTEHVASSIALLRPPLCSSHPAKDGTAACLDRTKKWRRPSEPAARVQGWESGDVPGDATSCCPVPVFLPAHETIRSFRAGFESAVGQGPVAVPVKHVSQRHHQMRAAQ